MYVQLKHLDVLRRSSAAASISTLSLGLLALIDLYLGLAHISVARTFGTIVFVLTALLLIHHRGPFPVVCFDLLSPLSSRLPWPPARYHCLDGSSRSKQAILLLVLVLKGIVLQDAEAPAFSTLQRRLCTVLSEPFADDPLQTSHSWPRSSLITCWSIIPI
jgi:hypothetical protein